MQIRTFTSIVLLAAASLQAQYKTEAGAAMPATVPAAVAGVLEKQGTKILGANGQVVAELWFRAAAPPAAAQKEDSVTWAGVAHGTLIGVAHFPARFADRRGNPINPGLYTLRFSFYPVNGDHQGVAPQRDFLVLSKIEDDGDPSATPAYEALMGLSKKAAGAPHPLVLSMWKEDAAFKPGFEKMGENDWVLQVKIGGAPVAIILVGKAEG
ncbi:MAG: hypothetical protein JNK48_27870 [Bryobacterales bacterium]|nr:hypothetical protein [Bryobacterales bacterium]